MARKIDITFGMNSSSKNFVRGGDLRERDEFLIKIGCMGTKFFFILKPAEDIEPEAKVGIGQP